jgi:Spy/CpxP family protein refolding chaperone
MKPKVTLTALLVLLSLATVFGQTSASPLPGAASDTMLKQQLTELQAKVRQLEAAVPSQSHGATGAPSAGMSTGGGMNMGGGIGGMNSMAGMQAGGGMGTVGDMGMMEQMMSGMNMPPGSMGPPHSALPGFPGASHIYHIGATGFFLDHAQHINLSVEQQVQLNRIKEQALLSKSATDRQVEQAEQELAVLTSSDQPDLKKIDNKVREIAKLAADEHIAFIKAVGEAAKLLTDEQRKILTGFATPAPSPAPGMSPMGHM